jgi:hypothetical protein
VGGHEGRGSSEINSHATDSRRRTRRRREGFGRSARRGRHPAEAGPGVEAG